MQGSQIDVSLWTGASVSKMVREALVVVVVMGRREGEVPGSIVGPTRAIRAAEHL